MKKYFGAAIAFALAATLMTGCGCTNQAMEDGTISDPTTVSTTAATMPSSDTTPIATTDPVVTTETPVTTDITVETTAGETMDTTDTTNGATETTGEGMVGRARRAIDRAIK